MNKDPSEDATASKAWTIRHLLDWTADYLKSNGSDTPRLDAEVLLADVRSCQRIMLYTAYDEIASDAVRAKFRDLVRRRAEGLPVAYLVGHREFFSLEFTITQDVLVPRPESEYIVTMLLDLAKEHKSSIPNPVILDVGTGSGILAICAAKHLASALVTAVDICPQALAVASANAVKHEVSDRIQFVESDLFGGLPADSEFDFVISNPPYIGTREKETVDANVAKHEPKIALFAGVDGLDVVRRLIAECPSRLKSHGWLIMEIGETQFDAVRDLILRNGHFQEPSLSKDQSGLPRIVVAQKR
jgi:release factor glutamine methyltransferase